MEQEKSKTGVADITQVFRNLPSGKAKYEFAKRIKQNQTPITQESANELVEFLVTMPITGDTGNLDECAYFCEKYSLAKDLTQLYAVYDRYDLVARIYETQTDSDTASKKAHEAYAKYIKFKTKAYVFQAIQEPNPTSYDIENFKRLQEIAELKGLVKELAQEITPYMLPSTFLEKLRCKSIRENPQILEFWQKFFSKNNMPEAGEKLGKESERIKIEVQKRKKEKEEGIVNKKAWDSYWDYIEAQSYGNPLRERMLECAKKTVELARKANNQNIIKEINSNIDEHMPGPNYAKRADIKKQVGLLEEAEQEYLTVVEDREKEGRFEEALEIAKEGGLEDKIASLQEIIKLTNDK